MAPISGLIAGEKPVGALEIRVPFLYKQSVIPLIDRDLF